MRSDLDVVGAVFVADVCWSAGVRCLGQHQACVSAVGGKRRSCQRQPGLSGVTQQEPEAAGGRFDTIAPSRGTPWAPQGAIASVVFLHASSGASPLEARDACVSRGKALPMLGAHSFQSPFWQPGMLRARSRDGGRIAGLACALEDQPGCAPPKSLAPSAGSDRQGETVLVMVPHSGHVAIDATSEAVCVVTHLITTEKVTFEHGPYEVIYDDDGFGALVLESEGAAGVIHLEDHFRFVVYKNEQTDELVFAMRGKEKRLG